MVAVKSPHKIEYIGFSERTQNILFELSIVNPIYLECHISRNPGVYSLSSPTPPRNRDLSLNTALWLCFRTSHPRALLTVNNTEFYLLYNFPQAGTSRSWIRFLWNLHPSLTSYQLRFSSNQQPTQRIEEAAPQ